MGVVNMLKISGTTLIMMLTVVHSEPPINSYLPPRMGTSSANGGRTNLSTQNGAPDFNSGNGVNRNGGTTSFGRLGSNGAGNGPSKLYDVPIGGIAGRNGLGQFPRNGFESGQLSSSYGAPNGGFGGGNGGKPSTSYGVPGANENNGGGFGNGGNDRRPSTSYDVSEVNGNHRNGGNGKPSSSYGVPGANGNMNDKSRFNGGSSGGGPSDSYGSPNESGSGGGLSTSYGPPNRSRNDNNGYSGSSNGGSFVNGGANGYPSEGPNGNAGNFGHGNGNFGRGEERGRDNNRSYNDNAQEESTEPAKYEFSYKVKDQQTGSDYSHTETRDGDRAQGEFNVLLPDGRKQIVEYEADQDGFKPQIRYEGEANADGGYSSDGPNDNNGYSSGRPGNKNFTNNSEFNGGSSNGGYPNDDTCEGKLGGFNSGGDTGQSFDRNNNGALSGDIGGYFSNPPGNNIGGDNANLGSNRQNGGNNGYQY